MGREGDEEALEIADYAVVFRDGDLIADESKRKPLSDERITSLLQEKGYNIARRTVAKYREQLNIPVARLRKQL